MKNETFTPERIKAEADAFFEWDGEDRSLVTTTSCLLFAQHIAGLMQARAAQPAPVVPEKCADMNHHERYRAGWNACRAAMLAAAPAQGQQVEWRTTAVMLEQANAGLAQLNGKLRAELSALKAQQGEGTTSDKYRAELYDEVWQLARDMGYGNVTMALNDLAAFKALKAQQEPVAWRVTGAGGLTVTPEYPKWAEDDSRLLIESLYTAPQPAPSQDVAGLASSDPVAKAEFETRLRKEFESRWPKPKGVTWGAGINDYCVSEFAEGIALSYPDMWMAYKAGAMRTNQ